MASISPGVYVKIIDLSEYVQNVPSTIGFICLVSEKGPDNQFILTNRRDFMSDFGEPNLLYGGKQFGQGKYVANEFLKESDSLYVIRVTSTGESFTFGTEGDGEVVQTQSASYANLMFDTTDVNNDGTQDNLFISYDEGLNTEREVLTHVNYGFFDASGQHAAIVIAGSGRGAWYNNFKIDVTPHANEIRASEGIYILDVYKRQQAMDWDSTTNEWKEAFEIDQSFEVSFDPRKVDGAGDSMFAPNILNKYYRDLMVFADVRLCEYMCAIGTDWSAPFVDGPIRLAGGSDGGILQTDEFGETTMVNVMTDPRVMKSLLRRAYTGKLARIMGMDFQTEQAENGVVPGDINVPEAQVGFTEYDDEVEDPQYVSEPLNTEDYYFSVVLDAGYPSDVKYGIVELCQYYRKDCVAIIDNGDNKSPQWALWARQQQQNFNTYYAALYEGYSKIYDPFLGGDIWVSPVYHMASIIPHTDNVAELWYAPAGFNRATLASIKHLRYSPTLGWRDQFYLNQINPIVKFHVGYTIWGQLTTQRRPTALQDLNIVRLVLYIARALSQFCKYYIFEMNDSETWSQIGSNIEKFLKVIKDKRGLYSYSVEVGATAYELKAKQCHVNVILNPTRTIEQIFLNFFIV